MFARHPSRPRPSSLMRIGAVLLFACVALVALANVYLGFPHNLSAPQCNSHLGNPCLGCACLPTPAWQPPVATLVQAYPLLSAALLAASNFVTMAGFVSARRGRKSLNPLFPLLPVITITLIALVAIFLYGFGQRL